MRFEFEEKTEKQKYSFIVHIVEHEGYGTLHQLVNPLQIRRTRNYALDSILKVKKGILEPKNTIFSGYFNTENVIILENMEEKANEVIATAFKDFLNECMIK